MSTRLQRLLVTLLMAYFTLLGGSFYTERSAVLRMGHQLITAGVLALWLINLWRTRRNIPATPLDRPLLLTGAAWLAAAVFGLDPRVSLEYTWPILVHILGFYLLVDLMRRGRQRWIFEALFTCAAVVIIISTIEFVSWYLGLPLAPQFTQNWLEIGGLFTLPPTFHKLSLALNVSTLLGNFAATLVPLIAAWAMSTRQPGLRPGLWLLALGMTGVLVLTFSRGALIALGTSTIILLITWLLQPKTRARFPAVVRSLLNPRLLIGLTVVGGVLVLGLLLLSTVNAGLNAGDRNRLDLWRSAFEIACDRPLFGIGPYQYGSGLRYYGDPALSMDQDRLVTAHNLPLHTLAESGLLGLTASTWLVAAFARTWLRRRQEATPGRRRRLEGGLAALAGFFVQSMVDTFTLTPLIIPLLIVAAYTVAGDVTRGQAVQHTAPIAGYRRPIPLLLAGILLIEIAFLPVFAGNLAHQRAMNALAANNLPEALAATREARSVDPWLNLYPLHEAFILGQLAYQDPSQFLDEAIASAESSQQLNPTWDLGWHNLGGLYAQAGRYEEAAEAAQTAIQWNPVPGGYYLKLGEYYQADNRMDEARLAYFEALAANHNLGSSGFWTDPNHPARADILTEAVEYYAADPNIGLRLAVEANRLDIATEIARSIDTETADYRVLQDLGDWALAINDEMIAPCPGCYFRMALDLPHDYIWNDYIRLAEGALEGDGIAHPMDLTAEHAARLALFISEGLGTRAWYILAQISAQEGADDALIDQMLVLAVPPLITRQDFAQAVYGRVAAFDELPQTRTPTLYRYTYEPWLWLAERREARGDTEGANRVYRALLEGDPYLWEIRQRVEEETE